MAVNWETKFKTSSRLLLIGLVVELWLLTLYSISIAALAVFLYARRIVDSTMAAGVLFSFMGSIVSLIYVGSHCLLSRRFRSAGLRRPAKTKLDSACGNLPRLLMILWMVAAAMDLIVASRKPTCLASWISASSWNSGIGCRMHRAISALSLLALASTCTIFCINEFSDKSFYASLLGYYKPALCDSVLVDSTPSKSSCSSSSHSSSLSFDKIQNPIQTIDIKSSIASHSSWLQRRDSISSQRAVYPPALLAQNPYTHSRSIGSMPVLEEDGMLTPRRNLTRSSLNPGITTSALLAPSAYSQPSRMPSIFSSTSSTHRSPLFQVHSASQSEISLDLLSKTLDPSSPSWKKPRIRCVPLSEDPAIRKLAEGDDSNESNSDDDHRCLLGSPGNALPKRKSIRRKLFPPDVSRSIAPAFLPPPPAVSRSTAGYSAIRRVPVPRASSMISSGSVQSEGSFSVRRPPAAARWSQQREKRQCTYRTPSACSGGQRSNVSMSSWCTDTIHE